MLTIHRTERRHDTELPISDQTNQSHSQADNDISIARLVNAIQVRAGADEEGSVGDCG